MRRHPVSALNLCFVHSQFFLTLHKTFPNVLQQDRYASVHNMEFYQLRTFLIVAEEGSITGAARRLYTTPPSVTTLSFGYLSTNASDPLIRPLRAAVLAAFNVLREVAVAG